MQNNSPHYQQLKYYFQIILKKVLPVSKLVVSLLYRNSENKLKNRNYESN